MSFSQVSRSGLKYTWTISGQTYGNGQYVAEASSAYAVGTTGAWPPSGAFDHKGCANKGDRSGWHKASDHSGPHWLTVQLPEAIRLDYYTISSRRDCCSNQFPQKWVLRCVDNPDQKVTLDTRSGQSLAVNQCRLYPAKAPSPDIRCKKFEFSFENLDSLSEVALYGTPCSSKSYFTDNVCKGHTDCDKLGQVQLKAGTKTSNAVCSPDPSLPLGVCARVSFFVAGAAWSSLPFICIAYTPYPVHAYKCLFSVFPELLLSAHLF